MKSKYGLGVSKQSSVDKLKFNQKDHQAVINSRKRSQANNTFLQTIKSAEVFVNVKETNLTASQSRNSRIKDTTESHQLGYASLQSCPMEQMTQTGPPERVESALSNLPVAKNIMPSIQISKGGSLPFKHPLAPFGQIQSQLLLNHMKKPSFNKTSVTSLKQNQQFAYQRHSKLRKKETQ